MSLHAFYSPTEVIFGVGAHRRLGSVVARLKATRVLLVVDPGLRDGEICAELLAALDSAGVAAALFSDIAPDPTDLMVAAAERLAREHGAEAVIAFGGGSTIDVAKAVAILVANGGRIHQYEGIEKFSIPPLPLVAIPSTAGTGSEVSGSCVITDTGRGLKMSIRHAALNPARVAILDPLVLIGLPAHVAMHAGMDAFVHAFESYISLGANPFTDTLNLRAMELIGANIRRFVADRADLEAGEAMLLGSAMAGMSFGQTGLGNVHCLARFVGAFFHLSHGLSNALCLPHVAEFNRPAATAKFARVALALGEPVDAGDPDAAKRAVDAIRRLCEDLGVPRRLRDAGVAQERFDEIADLCVEADYNRWNPRRTSRSDFKSLLELAF